MRKANPWTIMAAYNRLNGTYCAENAFILQRILQEEWQYDGIVVSDWGAVNDRAAGVQAGMHLQMPGAPSAPSIVAAVRDGTLPEGRLDTVVRAVLRFVLRCDAGRRPGTAADLETHHNLARLAGAEAIVLLKNERGTLPLDVTRLSNVAVVGAFASAPRFQGSGSSQVVPTRLDTVYQELARIAGPSCRITFAAGYSAEEQPDTGLIAEACAAAQAADAAVIVVGLPGSYEEEGVDRRHMDLPPSHNVLVEAVLAAQPRSAVVLVNGSAVTLPWVSSAPAILEAWLGGQAGGGAIADVLTGRVNPSGKLAETFPERLEDTPAFLSFPGDRQGSVQFSEGLFIGYRWYDARAIDPLFAFGHGLSYTTFSYADLVLDKQVIEDTELLHVSLQVRNDGDRAGKEAVQLYVREQQPRLPRPHKELKAFAKVSLQPGEGKQVRFSLDRSAFAFYDPLEGKWVTSSGPFELLVGASSRDIRLTTTVQLKSTDQVNLRLTRLTSIRTWLAHPLGRKLLEPHMDSYRARLDEIDPAGGIPDFFLDMPVAKLVSFGVLDPKELNRIVLVGES